MNNYNKLAALRVLGHAAKQLNRVNRIDREKLSDDHKVFYDVLVEAYKMGYKGFDTLDGLVVSLNKEGLQETMIEFYEVMNVIMPMIEDGAFNVDLALSKVATDTMFAPMKSSLTEMRAEVQAMIDSQFSVEGFPLPIVSGKLNSVVAPSHSGKTVYSLGLAASLARSGHKVVYLTTEEDELSVYEKMMAIDESDVLFDNMVVIYQGEFNKRTLENFVMRVGEEGYEFLIIDYLKKSMWDNYSSDHVVMEEINSTILKAMAALDSKISVFAFVQGNREAFNASVEELVSNTGNIALMIDGGMPTYRSADNLLFIKKEGASRVLVVGKSRRHPELLGAKVAYNVNLFDYTVEMGKVIPFSETVAAFGSNGRSNKKDNDKFGGKIYE